MSTEAEQAPPASEVKEEAANAPINVKVGVHAIALRDELAHCGDTVAGG
jgi:hypothetical protein